MDDLITLAGAENSGRTAGDGWPSLSPERVLARRPDIILAGTQTVARVKARSTWSSVPAVANGRVYSLGLDEAVRPGPRLVDALKRMIAVIYQQKAAK